MSAAGWHPVSLSDGLEPGTSAGTRLFDKEIVVWRDGEGGVHAWEDRCPHRGMRLSFGFVRGNHIACLYHGWQYDAGGQCRYIPAHPNLNVPPTIRVATYPCREALGMVWVHARFGSDLPPGLPDDRPGLTPVRSLYIDRPVDAVMRHLGAAASAPVLTLDAAGHKVIAGVQPFSHGKAALHLVIDGTVNASARHAVAAWAEEIRREIESGLAASALEAAE